MLKKTLEKLLKRLSNKQRYFIDSSILLEIILKQNAASNCRSFLNSTKAGNKICVVSNSVLGEVVCVLLFNEMGLSNSSIIAAFEAIFELTKDFAFVTIDKETIEIERKIREKEGDWLQQMDLLNLASAIRHDSIAFVTLDPDFSEYTGKKFRIKIINPRESK